VIGKLIIALRPADLLNLLFLIFLTSVAAVFHEVIDGASCLILLYSGLILVQLILMTFKDRSGLSRWVYDLIFPVICILIAFDSLGKIVHSVNPTDIDPLLIKLDFLLFGFNPTVALEKITFPLLTDLFQLAYTSYYFLPVSLGIVLKVKGKEAAFDRSLFMLMLCFYLSYVGYLLFPAIGPRFTLAHLQHTELKGLIMAGPIQEFLNRIEGIKRDAFPSGHTGIALTVLYLAHRYEKTLFRIFMPVVAALIFSTVYCRYHYVVDVIGGIVLTGITILFGEVWYEWRSKRINPHR